eukprot:CAMPEP_0201548136 /NCGR_PEP_ID=MMETSP0173_2-20130828/4642_1 /ASSEMBLY_ACC=CAM_ASM_000268 /TAXON_ID=218659 /ORGANISM="Vexillifera sp., Strain DIVA3 564/2" /LENGTH=247 /DNA_ID=CAMNT_0047957417 /DNA_START=468 /DNA_END=1211 /DNA_ORIENTATION=-
MAIGKQNKKGKKGGKKRVIDPFVKKDWYIIKAPSMFSKPHVGRMPVSRTVGTKLATDSLKGRVIEVCLADLNQDEDQAFRKIKLKVDEIRGNECLTNFYGMDFTTDKLKGMIRKWQTLIEAFVDVKTTDGYALRLFCIGFTNRRPNQIRKTSYAKGSQVRRIRKRMVDIMIRESASCSLKDLVGKFVPNAIGRQIERETQSIYPLRDCYIRKAKVLRRPPYDVNKLLELHGTSSNTSAKKEETGTTL